MHYSYSKRIDSEKGDLAGICVSCCGERHELAVHEKAFEPAFLATGSQLKVGTLLVVDI